MKYKYRWYYALLLCIFISSFSYVYDFKPKVDQFFELQEQEKKMALRATIMQRTSLSRSAKKNCSTKGTCSFEDDARVLKIPETSTAFFSYLFLLATNDGLKVQSLVFHKNAKTLDLYLRASANFRALLRFNHSLQNIYPIHVMNFAYQLQQGQILIEMEFNRTEGLIAWQQIKDDFVPHVKPSNNPFCTEDFFMTHSNALSTTPIDQMKMIGFMQQGTRAQALILLPNQQIVSLKKEMFIGVEHAQIKTIDATKIVLQLIDKKQKQIRM